MLVLVKRAALVAAAQRRNHYFGCGHLRQGGQRGASLLQVRLSNGDAVGCTVGFAVVGGGGGGGFAVVVVGTVGPAVVVGCTVGPVVVVGCCNAGPVVVGCCNADSLAAAAAALVVSRYPLVFDDHLKENNQNNQSLLLQVRTVATLVDVVLRGSLASLGCIQDVLQHIPQSPPG